VRRVGLVVSSFLVSLAPIPATAMSPLLVALIACVAGYNFTIIREYGNGDCSGPVLGWQAYSDNCTDGPTPCAGTSSVTTCSATLPVRVPGILSQTYDGSSTCDGIPYYTISAPTATCMPFSYGGLAVSMEFVCQPGGFVWTVYSSRTCAGSVVHREAWDSGVNACIRTGDSASAYVSCK